MPPIEIRPVRPEEIAEAGEVAVSAFTAAYEQDLGHYAERLRDAASRVRSATVLVALVDGVLAGTVTLIDDAASPFAEKMQHGEAGIRMLSVRPDHFRRGIGRALSQACIELAREHGKHAVVLHADKPMRSSQALYESLGFVRDPSRDFSPDETTDLIAYRLTL